MRHYPSKGVQAFIADVLRRLGMSPEDASLGATILHDADLAGVDTHGIVNLATHMHYAVGLRNGEVEPRPTVTTLRDSPVAAAWDSGRGFGPVIAHRAMAEAIAKAERTGVGMITVRDGRHFGANGYFVEMAAEMGMVAMVLANTPAAAFPPGGRAGAVGTNPFAFAAPVGAGPPLVLDIALTAVSGSKVLRAIARGEQVPEGWVVDAEGEPSTDPTWIRHGGALELLGGHVAGHKGYALALMVDAISILAGSGSGLWQRAGTGHWSQGQWFAAWRIDLFMDEAEFLKEMQRVAEHLHGLPAKPGVSVLLPGERRAACRLERATHGVPIADEDAANLQQLAADTGTSFPDPVD